MNLGALIALVKLVQDAGLTETKFDPQWEKLKLYTEAGAVSRAEEGLGL